LRTVGYASGGDASVKNDQITWDASIIDLNVVAVCRRVAWLEGFAMDRRSAGCSGHTSR